MHERGESLWIVAKYWRMPIDMKSLARVGAEVRLREQLDEAPKISPSYKSRRSAFGR